MRHCGRMLSGLTLPCNHEAHWWVTVSGLTGTDACKPHLSAVVTQVLSTFEAARVTVEPILSDPPGRIET